MSKEIRFSFSGFVHYQDAQRTTFDISVNFLIWIRGFRVKIVIFLCFFFVSYSTNLVTKSFQFYLGNKVSVVVVVGFWWSRSGFPQSDH